MITHRHEKGRKCSNLRADVTLLLRLRGLIAHSDIYSCVCWSINPVKPTGHLTHHQFNIQQLYVLPALYLCVLYLSDKKATCATYCISDWLL